MPDRVGRRTFFCGLLVIAGLGIAARLWQAGESLWLDELHTSWVVSGDFGEIAPRARIGNQSPVYFYLVRLSTFLLGDNELALRMPSLLAGAGLIAAAGIVTWRWCGLPSAAWLAAALAAVDHNLIFFAQEARPYALVQVIALCQLVAFWQLQRASGWRRRAAVVGGWIVLFHLHYTAILLAAGELLWWLVIQLWQRGKGGYRPVQVLIDVVVTAAACGPAGRHLADIAARRAMWEMFIPQQPLWIALRWFHWDLYVLSTCLACAGLLLAAAVARRPSDQRPAAVPSPSWPGVVPLLAAWWAVPVVIAWLLTAGDLARIFFPRYLTAVAVAPMICAGLCLAICRGPRARGAALIAVVALAVFGNGLVRQFTEDGRLIADRRQDWRGAVAWLNAVRDDGEPVLVRSGLIEADRLRTDPSVRLREYCLLPVGGLYRLTRPGLVRPLPTSHSGQLSSDDMQLLARSQGGWLLINGRPATHETFRRDLRASFPGDRLRFVREKSFGNVAVWQVKL